MTTCILTSALGKIPLAPNIPERYHCLSRKVSVHTAYTGVGKSIYFLGFGNLECSLSNAMLCRVQWNERMDT